MLQIKNTVTEVKSTFDDLIGRVDTTEERISVLEDISTETTKTLPREEPKQKLLLTYLQKPCKQEEKGVKYLKC